MLLRAHRVEVWAHRLELWSSLELEVAMGEGPMAFANQVPGGTFRRGSWRFALDDFWIYPGV